MASSEINIEQLKSQLDFLASPDASARQTAEKYILGIFSQKGGIVNVTDVLVKVPLSVAHRLVVLVQYKNAIKKQWPHACTVSEQEKAHVRQSIWQLGAVLSDDQRCFRVFEEVVRYIISQDFPEKWPNLLEEICTHVSTADADAESLKRLYVGISVLLRVSKVFLGRGGEKRKPLTVVVEKTFPTMLRLGDMLVEQIKSSGESSVVPLALAVALLKKICHTFYSATWLEFPEGFFTSGEEHFQKWCRLFHKCMNLAPPASATNSDVPGNEEIMRTFWALQRRSMLIGVSFCRRRRPSTSKAPLSGWTAEDRAFDILWTQGGYLAAFTQGTVTWTLSYVRPDAACQPPAKVVNVALMLMAVAVRETCVFHIVLHDLERILTQVVLPVMRLNEEDQEKWESDPVGYVRQAYDCQQTYHDPRESSCEILHSLAEFHRQETITPLLTLIANQMNSGDELACEASMRFICNLVDLIAPTTKDEQKRTAAVVAGFDPNQMLAERVLPLVDHQTNHFLRYRAISVYENYASFLDMAGYHQHMATAWNKLIARLEDRELPVRIQAALALRNFLRSHDGIKAAIIPTLPVVMKHLFVLMDEVELEDLPETLTLLIEFFPTEIAPFGLEMAELLLKKYVFI